MTKADQGLTPEQGEGGKDVRVGKGVISSSFQKDFEIADACPWGSSRELSQPWVSALGYRSRIGVRSLCNFVTLAKTLACPEPQFPHMLNRHRTNTAAERIRESRV